MELVLIAAVIYVVVPAALIWLVYLKWVWPHFAVRKSPASDITLIKARLDGEAHRVVDVRRTASQIADESLGARGTISRVFRIYDVDIKHPDGTIVTRNIGVACTLFGSPWLVAYERGARKPLWTRHQASLP